MNSAVDCVKNGDSCVYTVTLSGDKLEDMILAIAPQAERLSITPGFGSLEVQTENERISSVKLSGSGTLSVALSTLDVSFGADLTLDDSVTAFDVPDAVVQTLTEK